MLNSIEKVRLGVVKGLEFKKSELEKRSLELQLSQTITAEQCHKSMITSMDVDSTGRYLISTSYGQFFIHDTFNFTNDVKYTTRKICKSGNQEQHFKGISTVQWFPNDSGLFSLSSSRGFVCLYNTNALKRPIDIFDILYILFDIFGGTMNENYLRHHMNPLNPQLISAISVIPNSSNKINVIDVRIGSKTLTLPSNSRNGLLRGSVGLSNKTDFDYCQLRWGPKMSTLCTATSQGQIIEWDIRSTLTYLKAYSSEAENFDNTIPPVKRSKLSIPNSNEVLKAHRKKVLSLRYTRDGNELFSLGMEGTVFRWDTFQGKNLTSYLLPSAYNVNLSTMDISGTGNALYTAWGTGLYIHNAQIGHMHRRIKGHLKSVSAFVYDNEFNYAYSGGSDCSILVYTPNYLTEKAYLDNLKSGNTWENSSSATTTTSSSDFPISKAPLIDMSDL